MSWALDPRPQSGHRTDGQALEDDVGGLYKEGPELHTRDERALTTTGDPDETAIFALGGGLPLRRRPLPDHGARDYDDGVPLRRLPEDVGKRLLDDDHVAVGRGRAYPRRSRARRARDWPAAPSSLRAVQELAIHDLRTGNRLHERAREHAR